ncbi:hypothetical protein [Actinocorallia longicatena]
MPDDLDETAGAEAALRRGLAEARDGNPNDAVRYLRVGLTLVRERPDRVAEPDRVAHDLLVALSELAYPADPALADRLLGEAARAWPASPRPLVVLARRAGDPEAVRRLFTAALARVEPVRLPRFLDEEREAAIEVREGNVILEVLLRHGLSAPLHDTAMSAWSARHRPPA